MTGDHTALRVINEAGEVISTLERFTQPLEDQINGLQRDIRGWASRYEELKRDKVTAMKQHPRYREAEECFGEWKKRCKHKRSQFTVDRFELVLPFLENDKYGMRTIVKAIEGAAYDPFEVTRRNGTIKRFDEWERIFAGAGSVEDFANRAPRAQMALAT